MFTFSVVINYIETLVLFKKNQTPTFKENKIPLFKIALTYFFCFFSL